MNIQQKSSTVGNRKRLTSVGKIIIFVIVAIIVVVTVSIFLSIGKANTKVKLEEEIKNAIDYAIVTCKFAVTDNKTALNEINDYKVEIEKEKKVTKKAELAQDMIQSIIGKIDKEDKGNRDELNGAKVRISIALSDYNKR